MGLRSLANHIQILIDGKQKQVLSLDIGSRYIKGLCREGNTIKSAFVYECSGEKPKDIVIAIKKNGFSNSNVNIALKGPDSIMRFVTFPRVEKTVLKQSFGYELGKYIPFPPDSVYFDVCVIEEEYNKNESLVLLAAVKKDFINGILEELVKENISLKEITLTGVSLLNLFLSVPNKKGNSALIDIGTDSTTLNVIKNNIPYLSREIKTGGKELLKKISSLKNISLDEANALLIKNEKPEELLEIGEEIFLGICEEMRSSFDYFEMNTGEQVDNLYLTGGFSFINGLDKIISGAVGINVNSWEPWNDLKISFPENIQSPKGLFTSALGLTL